MVETTPTERDDMNQDIRLSVGFWHHPKTKRLVREAGLEAVRSLQILWCWVAQHRPNGDISDLDSDDIEDAADWTGEQGMFYRAIEDRWLQKEDGKIFIHDWLDHNPWVAETEQRTGKALLSKLAQVNRSSYDHLISIGITSISRDEYHFWKNNICDATANASERSSERPNRSAIPSAPAPAPSPAPSPAPNAFKNSSSELPKTEVSDTALSLSHLLRDSINARSPNGKPIIPPKTNMTAWAKHVERMMRIDQRAPQEIESVIHWCQQDSFWRNNILSPAKLREKWPQLVLKMNDRSGKTESIDDWAKRKEAELEAGGVQGVH
jgi:hypothetical protein